VDDLHAALRPLVDEPATAPPPLDVLTARAGRRRARRRAGGIAVVAIAMAVPLWAITRPGGPATVRTSDDGTHDPVPATDAPGDSPFGPSAPWTAPALSLHEVPAFADAAAANPGVAAACPLLAPDDLGEGAGATPRLGLGGRAGAWSVEFDLPGGPGLPEDGDVPTADAGHNSFSISAVVMPPVEETGTSGPDSVKDLVTRQPDAHTWTDGSAIAWDGGESVGLGWSATIWLEGAAPDCLYHVTSFLSADHILHLVDHLRRVEPGA
jgi:hypothetical protein